VPGWQVIGETDDHDEALAMAREQSPDVVLIGMRVRDGSSLRTTEALAGLRPPSAVVVLSLFDSPEYVDAALKAGAMGYVLKQSTSADLVAAIQAAHGGRRYLGQGLPTVAGERP
jgi:DNA-binding NarL/FixJ family response regulator